MGFHFHKAKYEVILWTVHLAATILAVADRFTTNVWPRQSFTIGAGSAGNDRMNGFKEGPWSVIMYDVLARFSGRFCIVCFNFMLISRLRILEQYLASSWLSSVLDCSNITKSNIQAHKWNGIALCICTLCHVWSILVPCITHKYRAQVVPGVFEWPLSERMPPGFKDVDAATKTMSLQVDDVFRLVEMTLLLGIMVPLSIRWMSRCWHLGIHVHRFITTIYFVDIVRRHSHPHSWVLNTPIFVLWILDKIVCLFWRRVKFPCVIRETISDDYIALYWTVDNDKASDPTAVGSNFLMRMQNSWLESPHPFTSFQNRCNFLRFSQDNYEDNETSRYTYGAVIRTFHNARKPRIGGQARSHTEGMAESSSISIWGPFQGDVTNLIPKEFVGTANIVLAGSGSAINFQIDLMSKASSQEVFDIENNKLQQVILLYSTRDEKLFKWVVNSMDHLLGLIDERSKNIEMPKIRVLLACTADARVNTSKSSVITLDRTFELGEDFSLHGYPNESNDCSRGNLDRGREEMESPKRLYSSGIIELHSKRLDYRQVIPSQSCVFCQGSKGFKEVVAAGCRGRKGVRLYLDQ